MVTPTEANPQPRYDSTTSIDRFHLGTPPMPYQLRLMGGSAPNEGRVEARASPSSPWQSFCGAYFDLEDGSVICRQLGFGNVTAISTTAAYGMGLGTILSMNLLCTGDEYGFEFCPTGNFSEGDCQHENDAGVVCAGLPPTLPPIPTTTPAPSQLVRLVNGGNPFQGRVEVFLNNVWGTICDDSWDTTDARIVCKQLGFGDVFAATTNARFGSGTGPIHIDDTRCYGSEASILDCQHRGVGMHNCRHSEDAGVICLPKVNLAGGRNSSEGRVEIEVNGEWTTVCGNGWDLADANIVCSQLGFGPAIEAPVGDPRFGPPSEGRVYMTDMMCNSNFQLLSQCAARKVADGDPSCPHSRDAGAVCKASSTATGIRLVGGNNIFEGRVELSRNNSWGTVCDNGWDLNDAAVVCRQLGLGKAVEARKYASFGRGFGPIYLENVGCEGDEENLLDCPYENQTSCSHSEDAGVVCAPKIRLVGGKNAYQGRVEMYVNNEWGTICDTDWDSQEARVACRQLSYGFAASAKTGSFFGPGKGTILAENIGCSGYEGSLVQCNRFDLQANSTCDHTRDAGVICSLPENNITLRLVGGNTPYEGRIEIQLEGTWGTVCDNNWDKSDSRVLCRQLGLGPGVEAPGNATFGKGTGPIYVDNLDCRGHESSIALCPNNGVEVHNCTHDNDAGVVCSAPIRLVDGSNPFEGRVEVLKNFIWGTVCDDGWDLVDATVVCRELGFGTAKRAVSGSYFGSRSYGSIHYDDVACTGNEQSLKDCPHSATHDCSHLEDAGVVCTGRKLNCVLPVLPHNTYMSIIKASFKEGEVIAVICQNGNNSVEWRCGPDKQWIGSPIACKESHNGDDGPDGPHVVIGVVVVLVVIVLAVLIIVAVVFMYRNQRKQNLQMAVTMSDVLSQIETVRNSGGAPGDGAVKSDAAPPPMTSVENHVASHDDEEETFKDLGFLEDKDSKKANTGGYARLIE
ncbi:scavenger receptor cysteine-rich domain-containing protein DMBT1-like [Diadema setosum]|uniref:scavenger receptor cysteine-rich domain-containing protein DMBT1-like n=1 Tax=Diadema setosum TaxID=31175 RepID=UPI003B3BD043